jgi:glycopeptide antibiotics resistance protein
LQFATGRIVHMTFRVADINDVIFNTIGAAIGCGLFLCFARVVRHIIAEKKIGYNPIARYIVEKIQNK